LSAPGGRDLNTRTGAERAPTPRSTYRVQLTPDFTFAEAAAMAGYLRDLGISHLYTSPVLAARAGSTHGYDVVDHQRVSAELGGEEGFTDLAGALAEHGLGLVVDIVPNHMAVATPGNRWWMDVLANGRASRFAPFFDIDWPPPLRPAERVLVPVLGNHYGRVLEAGELRLVREPARWSDSEHDELYLAYWDHRFPISVDTLADLVSRVGQARAAEPLEFLARSLRRLPPANASTPSAVEERQVDGPILLRMLGAAMADPAVGAAVDAEIDALNRDPDALDALIARQCYRLAYWRTSARELDYRRFFDIDELVGLRVEDPVVFDAVHERVLGWVADGLVQGVRVDHVDGLRDPGGYLRRLRDRLGSTWLVVEKILETGEVLRPEWPVAGTTGYDFAGLVTGLFVDPAAEKALTDLHVGVTGDDRSFEEVLLAAKLQVMDQVLGSELNRLTDALVRVCEGHRRVRDFSRHDLYETLREVLAAFGVYRTYVDDAGEVSEADRATIEAAVGVARDRRPDLDPELFDLLAGILMAEPGLDRGPERELRAHFQQVSGPVMAKSEEDTAFYRYVRLLALNEVGGDPARFGLTPAEHHEAMTLAQDGWPARMLALSTHDTKRSEDVRARLAVLSEKPDQWSATVTRWRDRNRRLPGATTLDGTTELYLYQTLVGAHRLSRERTWTHLEKAVREAKVHTSWVHPDETYESGLRAFIDALYDDHDFQEELAGVVAPLVRPGRVNALAQKLLQLTAPGVPDLYQGQELWDLSLVDPDNRRPVDLAVRRALLDRLARGERPAAADLADPDDAGLAKLLVVSRALAVRSERPAAFGPRGSYRPLGLEGDKAEHDLVVGHLRGDEVAVVVPRLTLRHPLTERSASVVLPPGTWHDRLVDGRTHAGPVPVAELLGPFPVALLVRD
jgi:(1->4)-alpha-D-glucan 1-alpha-D-glucosylmutase